MRADEPDHIPLRTALDPARFEIVHDVPIFDEHEVEEPAHDENGRVVGTKKLKYTRRVLEAIAKNMNKRIEDTGDYTALCLGHTPTPEQRKLGHPQPPLVGFAGPYFVGTIGEKKKRYAIIAKNWAIFRDEVDRVRKHPRRSVEVWREENPLDRYIEPIALLGAETPRRDLGLSYSRIHEGVQVQRYTAMAPSANNTYIPGAGKKKKSVARCEEDEDEDYEHSEDPEVLDGHSDDDNAATKERYWDDTEPELSPTEAKRGAKLAPEWKWIVAGSDQRMKDNKNARRRERRAAAKKEPKELNAREGEVEQYEYGQPSGWGTNDNQQSRIGVGQLTDESINQIVQAISQLDFAKWAMEQMEAQQAKAPETVVDPAMMGDPNAMGGVPGMEGSPSMLGQDPNAMGGDPNAQPGGEMPDMAQGADQMPPGPDENQSPQAQDANMSQEEAQGNVPENENTHYAAEGNVDRGNANAAEVAQYALHERYAQIERYNEQLAERLTAIENRALQAERYSEIASWKEHYLIDEEAEKARAEKYSAEQWDEHRQIVGNYQRNPASFSAMPLIAPSKSPIRSEASSKALYAKINERAEQYLAAGKYKPYAEIEAEVKAEQG
jgi:hypothetical protein